MVVEFVDCAFGGYSTSLVEGFVEDAYAVEGTAVVTGWYAGAL